MRGQISYRLHRLAAVAASCSQLQCSPAPQAIISSGHANTNVAGSQRPVEIFTCGGLFCCTVSDSSAAGCLRRLVSETASSVLSATQDCLLEVARLLM